MANRASDKITQLTDNVYICRSGSVRIFSLTCDVYFLVRNEVRVLIPIFFPLLYHWTAFPCFGF